MGTYRERPAPADLAGHLRCTWTAVTGPPAAVLPDGCLDLMWLGGELVVAGPDTRPVPSGLVAGTEIAAVRFRPGAASAVLGVPAVELRDARVPLAELWARGAELGRRLDAAAGPAERVALLAAAVRERLADAPPVDPVARAVVTALDRDGSATRPLPAAAAGEPAVRDLPGAAQGGAPAVPLHRELPGAIRPLHRDRLGAAPGSGGPASRPLREDLPGGGSGVVAVLAARAGLSERQLHRRCLVAFGYGAKTLDRVLRLQRFLALGRAHPGAGLAGLAVAAGYADQAHLGHDCRALADATPTEVLA